MAETLRTLKTYYPDVRASIESGELHLSSTLRIEKEGVWYEKPLELKIRSSLSAEWLESYYKKELESLFLKHCYVKMLVGQHLIDNGDEPAEDQRSEFRRLVEDGVCDEMGRIKGLQVFDEKNGL